jgi:hypothetical protein
MAADNTETGYLQGGGILIDDGHDTVCGTVMINSDGSYENGYCWQYAGCVAPYYGAFAECYFYTDPAVCANVFHLTQTGGQDGYLLTSYVWKNAGGVPGPVCDTAGPLAPGAIAFWPSISEHTVDMNDCCPGDEFWVGYWGGWPGLACGWFCGADLDGFGGCPFTNIAPGIGFPTGWNNVSVAWGPTQAMGIGCEVNPCVPPVPTEETTWGQIKAVFN